MRPILLGLSLFSILIPLAAQNSYATRVESKKGDYASIEISTFNIKKNLEVPPEFIPRLVKQLPYQLAGTKKFKRVFNFGEATAEPGGAAIQMKGTVIQYDAGNRAKRYIFKHGSGTAEVVAHIMLIETVSGETVFERDVTAKLNRGSFGGSTREIADLLAKEIARVAKRAYF